MAVRIVEGKLPYTGGTGIGIDGNKVISLLLREENNLILVNEDNQVYTDLQLADGIEPTDDFPVGVTVGKVLQEDGWSQNGLILNWKTTSGDYARWLYGADGKLYFDGGTGTWKQVYYSEEVNNLFTQLRGELATVAFTGDYNDLINRPAHTQIQSDWDQVDTDAPDYIKNKPTIPTVNDATLTIQKNGISVATFTANSSTATTANITVPNVINNLTSTSTSDSLSAAQGKELNDKIASLQSIGRFLSLWNSATGQPISFPLATPYNYRTGDYFLVETTGTTNYRPSGVSYTGTASTTVETDEVEVGDMYIYDGTVWLLQINHGKSVSFANLAGQPSDNSALASALDEKANAEDVNVKVFHIASTSDITNAQAAINWFEKGRLTGAYSPLIEFGGGRDLYALLSVWDGDSAIFTALAPETVNGTSNTTTTIKQVKFTLTGTAGQPQTVTAISTSENYLDVNYLDTSATYTTPYTPTTPGAPATKKYVDDAVGAVPTVTVDSALSSSSTNPVENRIINSALNNKQNTLTAGTGIDITSNTVSALNNFGTSSTAAATVQKEVSIPGITTLNVGQVVHILPSVTSTVASSTLKVNSFTAYPMRYNGAAITTSTDSIVRPANIVTSFIFDGTYWQFLGHGLDSNTTYSSMTEAEVNAGTGTTARTITPARLKYAIQTWATGDVQVSSQAGNVLTSGMKIWAGTQSDYEALSSYDANTFYATFNS